MLAANPSTGPIAFTTIPVRVLTSHVATSSPPASPSPTRARLPSMTTPSNGHYPSPHDSGFSPSLNSRTTPSPTSTPPTSLSPSPTTPALLHITTTSTSHPPSHQSTPSNSTIGSNSEDWKSCKSAISPAKLSARSTVALPRAYDPEQQRPQETQKHSVLNELQEKSMAPDQGPVAARGRIPGPYMYAVAESSAEMMAKWSEKARGNMQAEPTSWWAYFYTSSENTASVIRRREGSVPVAQKGEKGMQKRGKRAGWKKGCGLGRCFGKKK